MMPFSTIASTLRDRVVLVAQDFSFHAAGLTQGMISRTLAAVPGVAYVVHSGLSQDGREPHSFVVRNGQDSSRKVYVQNYGDVNTVSTIPMTLQFKAAAGDAVTLSDGTKADVSYEIRYSLDTLKDNELIDLARSLGNIDQQRMSNFFAMPVATAVRLAAATCIRNDDIQGSGALETKKALEFCERVQRSLRESCESYPYLVENAFGMHEFSLKPSKPESYDMDNAFDREGFKRAYPDCRIQ